jgi:hypothetical protein
MAKQMLTAGLGHYGLGAGIYPEFRAFGHNGSNEGFRCQIAVFFDGKGVAVMTNSDAGDNVIREVLTTLAAAYGWPAFKPMEKSPTKWPESRLAEVAGRYRLPDDTDTVAVTLEGGRLYLAHPAFGKVELLAQSDSSLFLRDDGTDVTVVREDGRVVGLSARGQQARRIGR